MQITFVHPEYLWLIIGVLPLVWLLGLKTRSTLGRTGRNISPFIRALAVAAGFVALAEPVAQEATAAPRATRVILLCDRSQSVQDDPNLKGLETSLLERLKDVRDVVTMAFAGELATSDAPSFDAKQTDIERALDQLSGTRPDLTSTEIVILTDGRCTRGSAVDGAEQIALRGARVHVIPVGRRGEQFPRLSNVTPPIDAQAAVATAVRVTLESSEPIPCTISLLDADERVVAQRVVTASAASDQSTTLLRFTPKNSGEQRYTVRTESGGVVIDRQPCIIFVEGPPRILICDHFPDEVNALRLALTGLTMPVDVVRPEQWPGDLSTYAAVILSDLSGKELSDDQRLALRRHVEETGAGLVFIGGSNVVSEHWARNPLSELLPVRLRPRPAKVIKKQPDVAICFVFDRSASMGGVLPGSAGEVSKLELVKASVIATLHSLPDTTTVSVVTFDSQSDAIVPPTSVSQKEAIAKLVDGIGTGGGTDMYPGVRQGIQLLGGMSGSKYLVVLTDGMTQAPPQGETWEALAESAARAGISWTSVAVGPDADQDLLQALSRRAGGRYTLCDTGDQIPRVFVDQAKAIRRVADVTREPFQPMDGPEVHDLGTLRASGLPQLAGAIPADAKDNCRVVLLGETGDALLASWQSGAGRVIAFCSDAKIAWAKAWLSTPEFVQFWARVVSSVARTRPPLRSSVRTHRAGQRVQFTFKVHEEGDRPAENLICSGALTLTGGQAMPASGASDLGGQHQSVHWRRGSPGTYVAVLNVPADQRSYEASLILRRDDRRSVRYAAILRGDVATELSETGPDLQSCREIAFAGGGVCSPEPTLIERAILARPPVPRTIMQRPLWPWFIAVFLLMWPIDVWVRKLL
jgi:hypothetical protein